MKQVLTVVFAILIMLNSSIGFSKKKQKNDFNYAEGCIKLRDSLFNKIDTVLVFKCECLDCVPGWEDNTYFFWKKNNEIHSISVSSHFGREGNEESHDVFLYYHKYDSLLKCEKLDTFNYISGGIYYILDVKINNNLYYKYIPSYYIRSNEFSCLINYIYRIECIIHHIVYY